MFPFQDDNPTERTPVATYAIIAINVVLFLWMMRLPQEQLHDVQYHYGFVPARATRLPEGKPVLIADRQLIGYNFFGDPVVKEREVSLPASAGEIMLSLLTCMFLHGGWMHIIGNMWFLWIFGDNIEDRLGPVLYVVLYVVGGLLASACHWLYNPASTMPVIGASGAISAILGAYAITWPWARVHTLVFLFVFVTIIDLPALLFLGIWFLGQLLPATQQLHGGVAGGVAWWAHVGGFVAGLIMMPLFSAALGVESKPAPRPAEEEGKMDDLW
jgi:hypothetical protein